MTKLLAALFAMSTAACLPDAPEPAVTLRVEWQKPDAYGRVECPFHFFSPEVDAVKIWWALGDYESEEIVACKQGNAAVAVPLGELSVSMIGMDHHSLSDDYEVLTSKDFELVAVKGQDIDLGFVDVFPEERTR